ncbi:MAG TPA: VCBS repeat-containing protein [Bacilli bacterium]|nr:VCBS repeat-containing protein [Bacilli bacterium]
MEFSIRPDDLFGATVRVNGKWLGIVEEKPLAFRVPEQGEYQLLIELAPLQADPSGDVYPLSFARLVTVKDGKIVPPIVVPDGFLHLRKAGAQHQIFFIYPKVNALARGLETLAMSMQVETADLDRDGRLDTVETFATNMSGHVRVRAATGKILLQDVYPDNGVRVAVTDLTRDGRPDLLIFWREPSVANGGDDARMQLWDPASGSLNGFIGYTGVRKSGAGDALVERKRTTPYREVTELFRYDRKPGESATFTPVRTEEKMRMRADTPADTVEAFLSSLEIDDGKGATLFLAKEAPILATMQAVAPFYAHEIDTVRDGEATVRVFRWIEPGYYDRELAFRIELVQEPDKVSQWKIRGVTPLS